MPYATLAPAIDAFARQGDKPAVVAFAEDGHRTLTHAALYREIQRLATGISQHFAPGDRIALLAPDRPEWLIAALAAIRAGMVVVPLDLQASRDNLRHMLEDSGARLVFTTEDQTERLAGLAPATALLDVPERDPRSFRRLAAPGPLPTLRPEDPAALFYTSGTTGRPKGVPLTHANLIHQINVIAAIDLLEPNERVLLPLPLHHVYPFVIGMVLPLTLGLTLILPQALTGPQILRALQEGRATVMIGVPRLYEALYAAIEARIRNRGKTAQALFAALIAASVGVRRRLGYYWGRRLFAPIHRQLAPHLRLLACGGAAIAPDLAWRLEGLGWRMAIGYGLTETSPLLTMNLPPSPRLDSVGKPLPGVEIKIDSRDGAGEILAKGPNVFRGYHNLPDETRRAFTADGWFRTGDLGRIDRGWLLVTGRVKELIVTPGGENVQPEEVERVFCAHPFIQEFALLEREGRLVGLVLPDPAEIRRAGLEDIDGAVRRAVAEINAELPSYQRIVDFAVTRDPLPRTRLGKLRRHELPRHYRDAESGGALTGGPLPIEKMAEADRALLQHPRPRRVWDWLARRFPDQHLTPDTSLRLDLGIDSLGWLELTTDVQRLAGVELSETAVASVETVRDLLKAVQAAPVGRQAPSWERPEAILSPEDQARLRPHRGLWRVAYRLTARLDRLLMHGCYRLTAAGLEHLPQGPCVLAPNHTSFLDPFALAAVLPLDFLENTCWTGWTGVAFTNPFTRLFSRLARVLPIDPEKEVMKSLAFALAALQYGNNLVLFPEGQRSPEGTLLPLRPGLGLVTARHPVPIVPVHIEGTFAAWPVGKKRPKLFLPINVTFGAPIDPRPIVENAGDDAARRITEALARRLAAMASDTVRNGPDQGASANSDSRAVR